MSAQNGGQDRRTAIASSAQELILRNGYGYTTLDQVAEQAGVSKGLISYYFPTKDTLFLAVLENILARLTEDLERCYRADVLSLIHISEPTRLRRISYAVFCLKKKNKKPKK